MGRGKTSDKYPSTVKVLREYIHVFRKHGSLKKTLTRTSSSDVDADADNRGITKALAILHMGKLNKRAMRP